MENQSDAKIIRAEARHRLKNKYGIKVFAEPDSLEKWLTDHEIDYDDVSDLIIHAGQVINLPDSLNEEMQVFVHAPFPMIAKIYKIKTIRRLFCKFACLIMSARLIC